MKLQERISATNAQIATDIKLLGTRIGDVTSLTTTEKTNLVGAVNELKTAITNASSGSDVDDKIATAIASLKSEILDNSPTALDTLNELSAALNNDPNFATTLATKMGNKVDFSTAQTLTKEQKTQACENIGIGDPDTDFLTAYTTARGTL